MLALILLSMLGTGLAIDSLLPDDDENASGDTNRANDESDVGVLYQSDDDTIDADADADADLGASFSLTETGVSIELGEDETGRIAVMYYTDTEPNSDEFERDEARFYLVPEGVDWSGQNWENRTDIPGDDGGYFELDDFEEAHDLELLGVVDLSQVEANEDPSARVGDIETNTPIDSYYLTANTDGDDIVGFLPTDYVVTINGIPETIVTEDTVGSDGFDWISTDEDNITVEGGDGDDRLETDNFDVTLIGGDGDDDINAYGPGVTRLGTDSLGFNWPDDGTDLDTGIVIEGGAGDDDITGFIVDTVDGGEGDDRISISAGTAMGGTGDDSLIVSGENSEAHGGSGDDFVSLDYGATGYGGDGNDNLQVDAGTTSFGGAGDDTFTVNDHFNADDETTVITGGEGADTIHVSPRAYSVENENAFVRITDFDITEDVLMIDNGDLDSIDRIEITHADDGSYSDVIVVYEPDYSSQEVPVVIRLDGDTGITLDHIVVNA
ncbi:MULTISPECIES: calcium-binding protein [Pacificibacter]|uniref:calcium-binding protein n=1 Tax=Pacificibacter TaxID=1042323 RepID=UPI001C081683|nr:MULTISPECIES: hypothetical protein [Pacificibacter]MBU2934499.1 hypothetical protein [Pacificibacter marinus]MDO6617119.1 hypothetical protein [Pacificibacter sp. 1_MG-2023]